MTAIDGRLGLVQRVLPAYRAPFFDLLAEACSNGLSVLSGEPRPGEAIQTADRLDTAVRAQATNRHLLGGKLYLCWQSGLIQWLDAWQPDVLVMEANMRYLSSPAGVRWMHQRARPVIGWGLGAPSAGANSRGLRHLLQKKFLGQFDALITYSRTGYEQYKNLGYPAERIIIAPNAAAARPQQPPTQREDPTRDGRTTLLYVGRLQARKRIDVLLQACAGLPEALQPRLWIVGDGPERGALESLAYTLYPQAEFFGAQYGAELDGFFDEADLFVLPGTGGLAVQQAMAHGLPVVVAEADGTQADLVRPHNGLLVPPGNVDELCGALQGLLADPARLHRMGAESYRIVAEEINLEAMVESFAQAVRFVQKT